MRITKQLFHVTTLLAALLGSGQAVQAAAPAVIDLTQPACQFLEAENGINHGFDTAKKADCQAINKKTGEKRLAHANTLELKPGKVHLPGDQPGRALRPRLLAPWQRCGRASDLAERFRRWARGRDYQGLCHRAERGRIPLFLSPQPDP